MGFQCFLCSKKRSSNNSLHKFPKNPEIKSAWMRFCNLNETDKVSTLYLCSSHFNPSDYGNPNAREQGAMQHLKPGTVPSINAVTEFVTMTGPSHSSPELLHEGEQTPKKRKFGQPRYIKEISSPDFSTPRKARRNLLFVKRKIAHQLKKIKHLQQKNRRLLKRISTLEELVSHLRRKNLISENCGDSFMNGLPDSVKDLISRKLKKRGNRKYSPELRRFALTLQFYSSRAYDYVRKVWNNLLPNPSTLRQWYSVVDGRPGFCREALSAIAARNEVTPVFINLVLDEMSIMSQITYESGKFYGGIDLGTEFNKDSDNVTEATSALVFMAVGLNGYWKVPIAYFLINGLTGSERASLLTRCLELIHNTGAKVFSVTFDGAAVNLNMCRQLGANFDYFSDTFSPFFINPINNEKLWIFWDACHMLKLVRNALGDNQIIIDSEGNLVKWKFLQNLLELQENEGLHAGTKLTKKHIFYQNNRMNVKLAAQTFSERVYNAFQFVHELQISEFDNCMPTAKFCLIINNIFDLLNCRSKFSKKNNFNIPIDEKNFQFLSDNSKQFEAYICGLKSESGVPILKTNRKTGFLGLIICMRNCFQLFDKLKQLGLDYLLTFKLSQDFLETFFSVIRSRGGFNNNPNARQFESAYKRLLVRHEISTSYNSNCLADCIEILQVSSQKNQFSDPVITEECITTSFDHDYVKTLWTLTPYVENVIKYIAGFIVKKLVNYRTLCKTCSPLLLECADNPPLLLKIKNRGKLLFPSQEVVKICLVAERVFRQSYTKLFVTNNIKYSLLLEIFRSIERPFDCFKMDEHILAQDILDNHRSQLTKLVIETFLDIRLFHEAKLRSQKEENVRQKYTKLILFKNQ